MIRYTALRVVQTVPTLFGIAVVTFLLVRLTGNPEDVLLPPDASEEEVTLFRERFGLDRSLPEQFMAFVGNAVRLDFGESIRYGVPVTDLLASRIVPTLMLTGASLAISLAIALPIGFWAGSRPGGLVDRVGRTAAFLGQSVPTFYLGILLILVFSVWLNAFDIVGPPSLQRLVLPAVTLATAMVPLVLRVTRGGVLDVASQDHIRTARAKGLNERQIVRHHIVKNAAIPIVTIVGLQLGAALSGAVVTETVFSWPGIGRLLVEAISTRDYPVVQAVTILAAFSYVVVNLLVDLLYARLDPRIALS